MAIFAGLAPNEWIKYMHLLVKSENVTNTPWYHRNGARYTMQRSRSHLLKLARTLSHSLKLSRTRSNSLELAHTSEDKHNTTINKLATRTTTLMLKNQLPSRSRLFVLCHVILSDQDDARYLGGSWALVSFGVGKALKEAGKLLQFFTT